MAPSRLKGRSVTGRCQAVSRGSREAKGGRRTVPGDMIRLPG
ncbi:hypothetical protein THTE_2779 [Thermogutta terrifontis]|uniref:Uncharacterized protein n=1 Tax=Thermogutta terrifontis TaxID=1331910 RepID=A0A286RHD6_9BACT|nr:hypothetical protein THTE_2779 [Thermogutta terrifontis]